MKLDIEIPSLILINAPQGSGKSHLIRYIMYMNRKKFGYGIVFTNTLFEDDSFDYINKKYSHPEYDPNALTSLMKIQSNLIAEGTSKEAFVIFDDCIDANQFKCQNWDGMCYKNVLAGYAHIHAVGNANWAEAMVNAASSHKENRTGSSLNLNGDAEQGMCGKQEYLTAV